MRQPVHDFVMERAVRGMWPVLYAIVDCAAVDCAVVDGPVVDGGRVPRITVLAEA